MFFGTFCGHFAVTKTGAQDVDSGAVFPLILSLQFVGQIGVAHAVQVGHALADEAVGFRAVEEIQRGIQGESRLLHEGHHHHSGIFSATSL